jgi:hypothetical protein
MNFKKFNLVPNNFLRHEDTKNNAFHGPSKFFSLFGKSNECNDFARKKMAYCICDIVSLNLTF